MKFRRKKDGIIRYRLVVFQGCRQCQQYVPPQPDDWPFCRTLYDSFSAEPPENWVRPDCPLPGPGDHHRRYLHIQGCWDCPLLVDYPPGGKKGSLCRMTGKYFNYPWRYEWGYGTVMPLERWVHRACPWAETTDPPPVFNPWANY